METRVLESRIAALRGQVRRLLALHGLSRVVGVVIPLVMLAGFLDWFFHLDGYVRLSTLLALCGLGCWLAHRYVLVPLVVRFRDLDIALRIEEHWPGLNDRLTSTVQFLRIAADDDRFGSPELREATVRQTLKETAEIDFRKAIEPRPVWQSLSWAALALVAALSVVMISPVMSRIAMKRLFLPWARYQWPQRTHLTLLANETPRRVARGDPFTLGVAVAKGEDVPRSARATYRFEDGEKVTEWLRTVEGGVFRGRLEAVTRPFRFSVSAGDDSRSIRDVPVAVVAPPAINSLAVRLVSPAYTGVEPQVIEPGRGSIRTVEGTRLEIAAVANKPISEAGLFVGETKSTSAFDYKAERTKLTTAYTVKESAPFWFDLHDTEGFRNREAPRYDVRAIRDEAPRVVIDEPANDRDVPAKAVVPITFTVDDDFGIQSARIVYKIATGDSEPVQEFVLPLFTAAVTDRPIVKHREISYAWDLAKLKLAPGSIITFHADARDFDDLKGPNLGKSRELRLRVLSDDEINRQLDDQRREIREEIVRTKAMQEQAKTPVDDARRSLAKAGRLDQAGREELKNAEMIQRQVGNRITNRADGLDHKVRRFIEDLKNFKIPNPDAQKQMEDMQAGIARIRENHLEPAEQGMTRASKRLDEGDRSPSKPASNEPTQNQEQQGSKSNSEAQKDASQAIKDAGKQSQDAVGKAPKNQAGGKAEATQTQDQSQSGKAQEKASSKNAEASSPSPNSKSPVDGDLADAQTNQKAISDELQKMLDSLREFETHRGVVKDAQKLLQEQEQTIKQTTEQAAKPDLMGKTPDALTPEQKADLAKLAARQSNVGKGLQNLQDKMNEMAKRLEADDPLAAAALREAAEQSRAKGTAGKMGEAADQLEKNQMGSARDAQERARQELKDLVDSIQNRRERELARLVKEMKNAESELEKLRERQAQLRKQTAEAQKNPNAKERKEQLQKLAKEQAEIQKELDRQLQRLAKLNAESAARAAARAAGKMEKAQQGLEQNQGDQAGEQEEDALADLEDAQERLQQARKDAEEMLAMEQLARMGDHLVSLAQRQDKVVSETVEFDKLRGGKEDKLTLGQRKSVMSLGRIQAGLKDETGELIEKLEGAPVFALTLKRATEGMGTAAERLQALKTDEETQRAAKSAANRFKQLLDSLKADKGKGGGQQGQPGGGEGQPNSNNAQGDGIPAAAQLKMLKALQEEINERTDFFDELKRRKKNLTPEQTAELERLETDQGTLADLVRDLTRPRQDDGEE